MDVRIIDGPSFRLVGRTTRISLIRDGASPHRWASLPSLPAVERVRLEGLETVEPAGILQVSLDVDVDLTEGSEFTCLLGVAIDAATVVPDGYDVVEVPAGKWAVFQYSASPSVTWGIVVSEWFPSNPWRVRRGPLMTSSRGRASGHDPAKLWVPVEPSGAAL